MLLGNQDIPGGHHDACAVRAPEGSCSVPRAARICGLSSAIHARTHRPVMEGAMSGDGAPAPSPGTGCRVDLRPKQSATGRGLWGAELGAFPGAQGTQSTTRDTEQPLSCKAVGLTTPTAPLTLPQTTMPMRQGALLCSVLQLVPETPLPIAVTSEGPSEGGGQEAQAVAPHGQDPNRHTRLRLSMVRRGTESPRHSLRPPPISTEGQCWPNTSLHSHHRREVEEGPAPSQTQPTLPPEAGGRLTPGTCPQNRCTQDGHSLDRRPQDRQPQNRRTQDRYPQDRHPQDRACWGSEWGRLGPTDRQEERTS